MSDPEIVEKLLSNDPHAIRDFFFVRCRPMLTYIGQYFFRDRRTPEELIGEFYEFLSADDWHKLRIFKYSCRLNTYVTIIASRYFQHKRNVEILSWDEDFTIVKNVHNRETSEPQFFMEDVIRLVDKMPSFDGFLIRKILMEGEKPRDILDEAKELMSSDDAIFTGAQDKKQFAGYVYTRYNRARKTLQNNLIAMGYEK